MSLRPAPPDLTEEPLAEPGLADEYSSGSPVMPLETIVAMLKARRLRVEDMVNDGGELLR